MKIIAVGMNYAQHNKELGHTQVNREPVIFMKPASRSLFPIFLPRCTMKRKLLYAFAGWVRILLRDLRTVTMMR